MLERVTSIRDVSVVILRMSQLQGLDATGAKVITEMIHGLELRGITVLVTGIQPTHLKLATRVGVIASHRHRNHLFTDLDTAVTHTRSHISRIDASHR